MTHTNKPFEITCRVGKEVHTESFRAPTFAHAKILAVNKYKEYLLTVRETRGYFELIIDESFRGVGKWKNGRERFNGTNKFQYN